MGCFVLNEALLRFFGSAKAIVTEPEQKLFNLLNEYFSAIGKVAGMNYLESKNVNEFIMVAKQRAPQYGYFWDWLDRYGSKKLTSLSRMQFDLSNKEEVIEVIDYRLFVLEQYEQNGVDSTLLTSIADSLSFVCEELCEIIENVAQYVEVQISQRIIGPSFAETVYSFDRPHYAGDFLR